MNTKEMLIPKSKIERMLCKVSIASMWFADPRSEWISEAISYYVNTGRASSDFVRALDQKSERSLRSIISKCLYNPDHSDKKLSDDGIIKTVKDILKVV